LSFLVKDVEAGWASSCSSSSTETPRSSTESEERLNARTIESLRRKIDSTEELLRQRKFTELRERLLEVRAELRAAGLSSAFVSWRLAIVHDDLGDLAAALAFVNEALHDDPVAEPFNDSKAIIINRIRDALCDEPHPPGEGSADDLYELLASESAADDACHLAMARVLVARGDVGRAVAILDALVLLSPACADAWTLKASLARSAGDDAAAVRYEAEAAAASVRSGPAFTQPLAQA
jgi:tetratricopeptide (TPR) repeat protein